MTTPSRSPQDRRTDRDLGRRRVRTVTGVTALSAAGLAAVLSVLLAQGSSAATTTQPSTSTGSTSSNTSSNSTGQNSTGQNQPEQNQPTQSQPTPDTGLQVPDQPPAASDNGGWTHASSGGS